MTVFKIVWHRESFHITVYNNKSDANCYKSGWKLNRIRELRIGVWKLPNVGGDIKYSDLQSPIIYHISADEGGVHLELRGCRDIALELSTCRQLVIHLNFQPTN